MTAGATRTDILAKIRDVLADVVDDDALTLTEESTANDVANWDSINHVRLLMGLESELGIRFDTDEVKGANTVGELISLILKKLSP